jgi:hypothetical protein
MTDLSFIRTAEVSRNGMTFKANLLIASDYCLETVEVYKGDVLLDTAHNASFETRNLGPADKGEYTRVMCASIADAWFRNRA